MPVHTGTVSRQKLVKEVPELLLSAMLSLLAHVLYLQEIISPFEVAVTIRRFSISQYCSSVAVWLPAPGKPFMWWSVPMVCVGGGGDRLSGSNYLRGKVNVGAMSDSHR